MQHFVLLGAGAANLEALRSAEKRPLDARLTLVTKAPRVIYSGMAPGVIAGLYGLEEASIALGPLCAAAGARLIIDEAAGLDLKKSEVLLKSGGALAFDALAINTGSEAIAPSGAIPAKQAGAIVARFAGSPAPRNIAIAGGGAGGVELAFAVRRGLGRGGGEVSLFTDLPAILPGFPPRFRSRCESLLFARGVGVRTGARVTGFDGARIFVDGRAVGCCDLLIWATGAAPAPWLRETGLDLDASGFVAACNTLQAQGHENVFAAGDAASFASLPVPKSGLYAVRQGAILAKNLRRFASGRPLLPFKPQRRALYLLSTGERYAIGTRYGLTFEGRWVWLLKDFIDRAYVGRFALEAPR